MFSGSAVNVFFCAVFNLIWCYARACYALDFCASPERPFFLVPVCVAQ